MTKQNNDIIKIPDNTLPESTDRETTTDAKVLQDKYDSSQILAQLIHSTTFLQQQISAYTEPIKKQVDELKNDTKEQFHFYQDQLKDKLIVVENSIKDQSKDLQAYEKEQSNRTSKIEGSLSNISWIATIGLGILLTAVSFFVFQFYSSISPKLEKIPVMEKNIQDLIQTDQGKYQNNFDNMNTGSGKI